jgi:alpha-glucosidase (family GH31 glycosyl hydrolase)
MPDLFDRIRFRGEPVANSESVVVTECARFTVLTPRLIRLEWSEAGTFEDRSTYAFPMRYGPAPEFKLQMDGGSLVIDTSALLLRYRQDSGRFSAENLSIALTLDGEIQTWAPGMLNARNLRGTRRTLDRCFGDAALDEGIISRDGWALFDDSANVVFDDTGWVTARPDCELQDWYFFGYGHDYKAALAEYVRFGGQTPLVPRFVLGAWWSRYWAYSERDLKRLVRDFHRHHLPLDVLVVDMDWHTPHAWTGYTWNRDLFPDPPAFLKWVHDHGLRVTLNLHPAQGVQSFEEAYPRFAERMGVDPAGGEAIPFRITNKRFVEAYFELLHHPMEDEGVDFWWMDWQQGESSEVKGLDPLPWINHLHFCDSTRRGRRPVLYSRWGGLGNHRYPIGFSGDTFITWETLQFQLYMTATASNVLYGWWSHDIGGHMGGATEPELYARWVQFGALSPCLRLHATKDPRAERRPWKYPDDVYLAAKAAFELRYRLVPYVYTMARVAADTGVSLCRPMYYEHPEAEDAYAARCQYYFGDQIIAAPIVHPADPETGLATTDVWVPPGTWIDYQTKETFTGPRWVRLVGDVDRLPMLVKAGAIIPLARTTDAIPKDELILEVFAGAAGSVRLYEDDGITELYREGQCEWTQIQTWVEGQGAWIVEVAPIVGHCDALPDKRKVEVRLVGSRQPHEVLLDGHKTDHWAYDAETLTTVVHVPSHDKRKPVTVRTVMEGAASALGEAHNRAVVLDDVKRLLGDRCPDRGVADIDTVLFCDAPGRTDAIARMGGPFVRFVEFSTPEEVSQQMGRAIVGAPLRKGDPYDLEATFLVRRGGWTEWYEAVNIRGSHAPQILDNTFAFDGQVRTLCWEAEFRVTWKGQTMVHRHRSNPLFPAIYVWRFAVYNREEAPISLEQVVGAEGETDDSLAWQDCSQSLEGLPNLTTPHSVVFSRMEIYAARLRAGEPLAGYLVTTIICPDEREVVIECWGSAAEFCLNGQRVGEASETPVKEVSPMFWPSRRTPVMRLQAGTNTLVVHTQPTDDGRFWAFGGVFQWPDGDLMADLTFE